MAQFDVFLNPLPLARPAYPFVVAMQSDYSVMAAELLVAPIAAADFPIGPSSRLTPSVNIRERQHAVLVPRLTVMRSRDLTECVASIAGARAPLLAAIDYLFFGI